MSDPTKDALRTAACIAFRHITETTDAEREQVLIALIEVLPEQEAQLAERALFHLREQLKVQLTLKGVLENSKRRHAA